MTARLSFPLSLLLAALLLASASPARAESVLFASSEGRTAELVPELALAARSHDMLLLVRGLGDARTPLERAAAAQRIGRNVGTWAALWIEREPPLRVRAVAISGERIHEAPLPSPLESIDPRVFASVAASVLLEMRGRSGAERELPATDEPGPGPASTAPASAPSWAVEAERARPEPRAEPRFFLRAGVGYGMVYVRNRSEADRSPRAVLDEVAAAARLPDNSLDLASAQSALQGRGFACRVAQDSLQRLSIDDCGVAANPGGVVGSFSIDLALGVRLAPRLGLAATTRVAPDAGLGVLAHALLGLQLEAALLKPRPTGWWLHALAGGGIGRIQARPPMPESSASGPYATSGLGNVRVGLQLGYRFAEQLGLYAGSTLHIGLPHNLLTVDPVVGLEARL